MDQPFRTPDTTLSPPLTEEALEAAALRGRRLAYEEEEARHLAHRAKIREPRPRTVGYVVFIFMAVAAFVAVAEAYGPDTENQGTPIAAPRR
jgi:hypothetical protein